MNGVRRFIGIGRMATVCVLSGSVQRKPVNEMRCCLERSRILGRQGVESENRYFINLWMGCLWVAGVFRSSGCLDRISNWFCGDILNDECFATMTPLSPEEVKLP